MESVRCDYDPSQAPVSSLSSTPVSKSLAETLSLSNSLINICDQTNKILHIDLPSLHITAIDLDMPHVFPVKASWISLLTPGIVVVCGGMQSGNASREVLGVQVNAAMVMGLGEMREGRWEAGIVESGGKVYLFGGRCPGLLSSCEVFDLSTNHWSSIASMECARAGMTPTSWKQSILLVGGVGSSGIESYDTSQDLFRTVPIQLPYADQYTLAMVLGEELVVIQREKIVGMGLRGGNRRMYEIKSLEKPGWWFCPTEIKEWSGDVFFLDWACALQVWRFSPLSQSLTPAVSLSS